MRVCAVCYEPIGYNFVPFPNECSHDDTTTSICELCWNAHCMLAISTKQIPIPCPVGGCSTKLPDSFVERHIFVSEYHTDNNISFEQRYRVHRAAQEDPTKCVCPQCEESLVSKPTLSTPGECGECGFVIEVDNGQSNRSNNKQERLTQKKIDSMTKPCPNCRVRIEKSQGCAHVVCPHCGGDFCYTCGNGNLVGDGTIRKCKVCRTEYIDHRKMGRHRLYALLGLPFVLPFYLIYMTVSTILTIITFGCCCGQALVGCFRGSGRQRVQHDDGDNDDEHRATDNDSNNAVVTIKDRFQSVMFVWLLPIWIALQDFGVGIQWVEDVFARFSKRSDGRAAAGTGGRYEQYEQGSETRLPSYDEEDPAVDDNNSFLRPDSAATSDAGESNSDTSYVA